MYASSEKKEGKIDLRKSINQYISIIIKDTE